MILRRGAQNLQVRGVLPQWGGTLTVGNFFLPVNDIYFENIEHIQLQEFNMW